uniref:Uncharacterized protein n=1 Tax=Bacillus phage phiBTP1 TaxID=1308894 RepID=R9RVQ0_9CAUD|nr:hypothetical protein BTP1_33 [Bacillus phage phiBTP1]
MLSVEPSKMSPRVCRNIDCSSFKTIRFFNSSRAMNNTL